MGWKDAPVVEMTHDGFPAVRNADGSHSTELSVTVTDPRLNGGAPTNIPSLWKGVQLADDKAVDAALGSGRAFPKFRTIDEAVGSAKARSNAGGTAAPAWMAAPEVDTNPTEGMSTTDKVLAGIGQGMTKTARAAAAGLRLLGPQYSASADFIGLPNEADNAEAARLDKPLLDTTAGKVGSVVGHVAAAAPTMLVPGANTYTGATALGALFGGATTDGDLMERAKGAGFGAAGGAAGKGLGDVVGAGASKFAASRAAKAAEKQAANATRDATLTAGRDAGYVVTPSQAGQGGLVNSLLEGLGGKIKTAQSASLKNQEVTNRLARESLLLPENTPLTPETFKSVREAASKAGYEPLRNAGVIAADSQLGTDLAAIAQASRGASKSFPGLGAKQAEEVEAIVQSLSRRQFDAGDAIDATKILRESAEKAYAGGDKQLGKAYRGASDALEAQIERSLASTGQQQLLDTFREARKLIAKSFSAEKAATAGNVSAPKLAAQLSKGKPLSGELKTAAEFAQAFPKSAQQGVAVPAFSPLDMFAGGAGLGSGNPALAALFAARPVARSVLLNQGYQRAMINPTYETSALTRSAPAVLDTELARALARIGGVTGAGALLPANQ